jgi:hypothetical protein
MIEQYMKNKMNMMLVGMPGIGKTDIVKAVAATLGYDLIIFHPVIADPTDFKGFPWCFEDANGKRHAVFVPFDQLEALISAKGKTICFLDDFGQAPVSVQAACMQLLYGGEIAGHKISIHVRFMACTNRKQDRAGVSALLEPVKSRFHGIFELIPDLEPFKQWLIAHGHSPVLVAFINYKPEWITGGPNGWKAIPDIVNQPCPRTIAHLGDVVNLQLPIELRQTGFAGAVGPGMANDYMAFERLASKLPDIRTVLTNPDKALVPEQKDIQYAMLGALHHNMHAGNISNIYKYIKRAFSRELQMVFHFDVEAYKPEIVNTTAYIEWSKEHGDLLSN